MIFWVAFAFGQIFGPEVTLGPCLAVMKAFAVCMVSKSSGWPGLTSFPKEWWTLWDRLYLDRLWRKFFEATQKLSSCKKTFPEKAQTNVGMSRTGYSFLGWGQRAQRRVHALPRYNGKTNGSNKIPEHRSGRKPWKFSFLEINEVPWPLVEQNWI